MSNVAVQNSASESVAVAVPPEAKRPSRAEHNRRLMFLAEKLLEGYSRRHC